MPDKIWEVKNQSDNVGELLIMGDITDKSWYEEDITPKVILNDLEDLGDIDKLKVKISSYGGSVFAGINIANTIKDYAETKDVELEGYVMGLAASIASVIATSLPKLIMYPSSMLMVHNPMQGMFYGNAEEFRKAADDLDDIRESLIVTYENKTNLDREEIIELLDSESWLTAEESVEMGFADEVNEDEDIDASIVDNKLIMNNIEFDMDKFENIPDKVVAKFDKGNINNKVYNNGKDDNDMPFKEFETEEEFNEFKDELLKGYVKAENVLDKFAEVDLDGDDLEEIVDKVKEVKNDAEQSKEELKQMKEDIKFNNRKKKLEDADVEVEDEDREEILNMSDKVFKMLVKSNKEKIDNKVNNNNNDDNGGNFIDVNVDDDKEGNSSIVKGL